MPVYCFRAVCFGCLVSCVVYRRRSPVCCCFACVYARQHIDDKHKACWKGTEGYNRRPRHVLFFFVLLHNRAQGEREKKSREGTTEEIKYKCCCAYEPPLASQVLPKSCLKSFTGRFLRDEAHGQEKNTKRERQTKIVPPTNQHGWVHKGWEFCQSAGCDLCFFLQPLRLSMGWTHVKARRGSTTAPSTRTLRPTHSEQNWVKENSLHPACLTPPQKLK